MISTLLKSRHANNFSLYCFSLENMTTRQQLKTKSSIVDANNYLNGIFLYFDFFNSEFSSDFRLIDNFFSHFSFYQESYKNKESKATHLCNLNNIFSNTLVDSKSIIIVSDANIRNIIVISISYIYSHLNDVKKTIHYAVNIISAEAELFVIRYGINQAIQILEATYIIVITDTIHVNQCIFDSIVYPY